MTRWCSALVLALLSTGRDIRAQVPLPDPDLDLIGNGTVMATLAQADGGLVIGGNFQSINGIPRRNLARLRADRSLDMSWDPSPDSWVVTLAQAPGGSIYAGGYYSHIDGVERPGLARVDAVTGSVDTWAPELSNGAVALFVDSDGSIVVSPFGSSSRLVKLSGTDGAQLPWSGMFAGADYLVPDGNGAVYVAKRQFEFDFSASVYRATISKLSIATGEAVVEWSSFIPGSPDASLQALEIDGGVVYAGGTFGLRKLDSTSGQEIAGWNAPNATIAAIAIDGPTHIIVGGDFEAIHGQPRHHLARLSSATGLPTPGWTASTDGAVDLIHLDADGTMDIAGRFQSTNDEQRIGFARLNADRTLATSQADVELPAKAFVVAAQASGGIVVGGPFHRVGASSHRNILRLQSDGTLDDAWNGSLPSMPWVIAAGEDGSVYAAMNRWSGNLRAGADMARINALGDLDHSWIPAADGWIDALAVSADGDVLVGGEFATISGMPRKALAKLDAKSAVPLPSWNAQVDCCSIRSIVTDGDTVYLGGDFASIGGQSHKLVARLSASTGAADPAWNPPLVGEAAYALALDGRGSIYVGGALGSSDGHQHMMAKVQASGTGDLVPDWSADFAWGPNFKLYTVWRIAVDLQGTVYASGFFSVGTHPRPSDWTLAKLSGTNGLIDLEWNPVQSYSTPYGLGVSTAGSVFVAGYFDQAGGVDRSGLAAFAPTLPNRLFIDGFEPRF